MFSLIPTYILVVIEQYCFMENKLNIQIFKASNMCLTNGSLTYSQISNAPIFEIEINFVKF